MNEPMKETEISDTELSRYLDSETSDERLKLIWAWRDNGQTIDDKLLKGLLQLPLSDTEIMAAFEICSTQFKPGFELWVMENIMKWDQNIVAVALRAWAKITDRILWHRLIPIASIPGLPQRIRFTILDLASVTHGYELTRATLNGSGWEELSSAFHALLIERAVQYDLPSDRLTKLVWKILSDCKNNSHPENRCLIPATTYLIRNSEQELKKWLDAAPSSLWKDLAKLALEAHIARDGIFSKIEKSHLKSQLKSPDNEDAFTKMPPLWSRASTPSTICEAILKSQCTDSSLLQGLPRSSIVQALKTVKLNTAWIDSVIGALPVEDAYQACLHSTLQFARSYDTEKFAELAEARRHATAGRLGITTDVIKKPHQFSDSAHAVSVASRHPAYKFLSTIAEDNSAKVTDGSVWGQLAAAWLDANKVDIRALTTITRQHKGIASLANIMILSKMQGRDDAVLKLLDYIRSNDETELRAVARSLGKINTSRSHLELIAMITRPNASLAVQQEIVAILSQKDLKDLQKELRSAVQDLRVPQNSDHPLFQIRDELSSLVAPIEHAQKNGLAPIYNAVNLDELNLDQELATMLPHYKDLSSEVKRALRTALFFNQSFATSSHANSIDLSPLIDMQYKAMELLYREFFEDTVSQSLQGASIKRKLDVIGYARPIVRQMDEFEAYIASLPIVKDIPFFSKFKLRKMLRAICQFEPGRRFTLDGLKAFGLYFLVFGRQSCKAGLSNTFRVGTHNDLELAEFCKELHIFQDFRNRAAHEGFHPDASNDISGIWRITASIVQWAFKIRDAQKSSTLMPGKKAS